MDSLTPSHLGFCTVFLVCLFCLIAWNMEKCKPSFGCFLKEPKEDSGMQRDIVQAGNGVLWGIAMQ